MENLPSKQVIILQQKERYTGLIATLTTDAGQVERGLTIDKIIEKGTPLSVLMRMTERKTVKQILDLQLTKLAASFNLNLTLKDYQISQIIEDLIEKYPNETIEDFIYTFKQARQGAYGQVFRLDSAVVFDWMAQHLTQKYDAIESKLYAEKDNIYKVDYDVKPEPLPIDSELAQQRIAEWLESLKGIQTKAIVPLSDKQIKEEGKEVVKEKPYPIQRDEKVVMAIMHNEWVATMFHKDGKKKENWLPFEEWVKM